MKHVCFVLPWLLFSAAVASAGGDTEVTEESSAATTMPMAETRYNEAPLLADRVAQGLLPPVDDRLPDVPFVEQVVEEIGTYGGTWHRTTLSASPVYQPGIPSYRGTDRLVWYNRDTFEMHAEVLAELERQNSSRTWVMHMRSGLRWSDGELFDADDILFWWNDVALNEQIVANLPSWLRVGGAPATVEKIDEWTVSFTFAEPHPHFMKFLMVSGEVIPRHPRHYMEQFHQTYADEAKLAALLKERGFETWPELYTFAANERWSTVPAPEKPRLDPWITISAPSMGPFVLERNPYYWKVDPADNQLPYIDEVVIDFVSDVQTQSLRAISAELDAQRIMDITILPELLEAERRGELQAWHRRGKNPTRLDLSFNLTHDDPELRKIFQDKRFRIAMSHAVNREELSLLGYGGLVQPTQIGPYPGTRFYNEQLKNAYLEYDPDKANALLDEIGLDQRDSDGYRLRADGERFSFVLMNTRGDRIPQDPMEMVTDSFEDLGIEVIMKWGERQGNVLNTGEWDAMLGAGHNTVPFGFEIGTGAGHVVPLTGGPNNLWFGYWANDWARWFVSNGEVGEEPPEIMKQIVATYRKLQVSEDPAEMRVLAKEIFDIAHENLWVIGYVSDPGMGFVASNNMGNIGDSPIPASPVGPSVLPVDQFFFKS